MADGSSIEWTDATWNPVKGSRKCYAARFVAPDHRPTGEHCVQTFDRLALPGAHLRLEAHCATPRSLGSSDRLEAPPSRPSP